MNPQDFLDKGEKDALGPKDVVLTFDDALLCQVDVALPVLAEHSLAAIFHVYSSVFTDKPDPLEIYADFRATTFENFQSFWMAFYEETDGLYPSLIGRLARDFRENYLPEFPFYTDEERKFRYLRDELLGRDSYNEVMEAMLESFAYDRESRERSLWMTTKDLQRIANDGHVIGLHSDTHPVRMSRLPKIEQEREYKSNFDWIVEHIGVLPKFVAHPCGDYSSDTLEILRKLGVRMGFRSSPTKGRFSSILEIPRQDHSALFRGLETE